MVWQRMQLCACNTLRPSRNGPGSTSALTVGGGTTPLGGGGGAGGGVQPAARPKMPAVAMNTVNRKRGSIMAWTPQEYDDEMNKMVARSGCYIAKWHSESRGSPWVSACWRCACVG